MTLRAARPPVTFAATRVQSGHARSGAFAKRIKGACDLTGPTLSIFDTGAPEWEQTST